MSSRGEPAPGEAPPEILTPTRLRDWSLPSGAESKYDRGRIVVIGGARHTPGAALLAGTAALRVGAGRLSMGVAESAAVALAVAMPEAGVIGLSESSTGAVRGNSLTPLRDEINAADALVIGSGLDDAGEARKLVLGVLALLAEGNTTPAVLLDAYALGVLPDVDADGHDTLRALGGKLVLTPNTDEAARLLGRDISDLATDLGEIADRYQAVVTCFGVIAAPGGRRWEIGSGQAVLSTSGSGDVLAGAIGGLLARGADPDQAACWGTHLHATAGDRLAARIGPTGTLARELADELPMVLAELGQHA
ncbi:NAD(P)H-hydrate dehydratase [Glaciibacter sp. 2TAF33]|uniref:NAD(P)H-hydrate dehydratase n=1 Tax=Glaciibacter sp. 2TAF33 TaxID=3233015 RepID=UPI003F8EAFF5